MAGSACGAGGGEVWSLREDYHGAPKHPKSLRAGTDRLRRSASCYPLTMAKDTARGMKSAYELALERLEAQGIERPDQDTLSDADRAEIEEIRSKAKAKVAQLEILHRGPGTDPEGLEEFRREKQRIEDDRDRKIEAIRSRR